MKTREEIISYIEKLDIAIQESMYINTQKYIELSQRKQTLEWVLGELVL